MGIRHSDPELSVAAELEPNGMNSCITKESNFKGGGEKVNLGPSENPGPIVENTNPIRREKGAI